MTALADADRDVVAHTTAAIGRTGAGQLEVGFLDEDPPHRWWATASYRGTRVTCENQDGPVKALLGLYGMLAAGGRCTGCGRTVALDHSERGLVDGARMHDGVFETRRAARPLFSYCVRRYDPDAGWPGCEDDQP